MCNQDYKVKTMKPEKRQNTDWKDGFLFLGNHLALDFLNTRPIPHVEPVELLTDFKALVRWFRAADLLSSREAADFEQHWAGSARARRAIEPVRDLREKIRKEILVWEEAGTVHNSTVHELNRLMADYPMRTWLQTSEKELVMRPYFVARQPEDLLAPLAYAAATLFSNVDRTRVRKCDHCVLHFHDTSKKGTRRWCSMRLCGNRMKVAAYAARRRAHQLEGQ